MMSPPLLPRPDISGLERNVDYHWINFQGSVSFPDRKWPLGLRYPWEIGRHYIVHPGGQF